MFMLALVKDFVIDVIVLGATILFPPLGWILGLLASIIVGGVFTVRNFLNGGMSSKKAARTSALTMIAVLVGLIPIVRFIIPEFTFLVLFTYLQEKKEARKAMKSKPLRVAMAV